MDVNGCWSPKMDDLQWNMLLKWMITMGTPMAMETSSWEWVNLFNMRTYPGYGFVVGCRKNVWQYVIVFIREDDRTQHMWQVECQNPCQDIYIYLLQLDHTKWNNFLFVVAAFCGSYVHSAGKPLGDFCGLNNHDIPRNHCFCWCPPRNHCFCWYS